MAEALYRKYRPQIFEDVVGQEPIERTLKNAIAQDKLSHAYLFCGPRGTGKTTTARLLAKAVLCEQGPTPSPDGTCEDCTMIAAGTHPDVYELDAASRTGVENVREEIISRVQFAPTRGRFKVYVIDEVHMLSTAAFNALLKTLEEPPSHIVFILCTTDPQKVPETIQSRCQRFDFHRISPEAMVTRLGAVCVSEGVEFEGEALDLIAHRAEGGLRNALTSLEQIIAFENGQVTLEGAERILGSIDSDDMAEIVGAIGRRDVAACFRWTAAYVETGADLAQFVRDMAEHMRNMYILQVAGADVELDVPESTRRELSEEARWFGPDRLARLLGVIGDLTIELKTASNPRLAFEIALTRMVRPDSDLTLSSLAERVEALERGSVATASQAPAPCAAAQGASFAARADSRPSVSGCSAVGASDAGARAAQATVAGTAGTSEAVAATQPAGESPARAGKTADAGMPDTFALGGTLAASSRIPGDGGATGVTPSSGGSGSEGFSLAGEAPSGGSAASANAPTGGELDGRLHELLGNPAALQRMWQAALASLKKRKTAYGVLFMGTKAAFDAAGERMVVRFPEQNSFAFNSARKPEVQDALASALAQAAGAPVPFAFALGTAGLESSAAAASAPASAVRDTPSSSQMDAVKAAAAQAARAAQAMQVPEDARAAQVPKGAQAAPASDAARASNGAQVPQADKRASAAPAAPVAQAAHEHSAAPHSSPTSEQVPYGDEEASASTDIESLLKSGFGDGVVFSEVE